MLVHNADFYRSRRPMTSKPALTELQTGFYACPLLLSIGFLLSVRIA